MGKGKPRAKHREEKDGQLEKLKAANRRLKSDNEKLKAELATYEAAFQKNITFLKGKVKDVPLEELIKGANKGQNLKQIEESREETYQEFKQKWKCFTCGSGIMKLTVINRQDGKFYYRRCNGPKCGNRTDLKPFDDEVEIS